MKKISERFFESFHESLKAHSELNGDQIKAAEEYLRDSFADDEQAKEAQVRQVSDFIGGSLKDVGKGVQNFFRRPMTDEAGEYLYDRGGPLWRMLRGLRGGDIPSGGMQRLDAPTNKGVFSRDFSLETLRNDPELAGRMVRNTLENANPNEGGLLTNPLVVGTGAGGLGLMAGYGMSGDDEIQV